MNRPSRWLLLASSVALAIAATLTWLVVQPTWTVSGTNSAQPSLQDALRGHVQRLAVDFSPRVHTNLQQLNRASAYIEAQLGTTSAETSVQSYTVSGRAYQNLIAKFGPSTDDVIVIGAHYDVAGE
jgi:acetylornithine deacetylase/succinyl-diaminopimelate desuccinylase-like protein